MWQQTEPREVECHFNDVIILVYVWSFLGNLQLFIQLNLFLFTLWTFLTHLHHQ